MNINKLVNKSIDKDIKAFNRVSIILWPDNPPLTLSSEEMFRLEVDALERMHDEIYHELVKRSAA